MLEQSLHRFYAFGSNYRYLLDLQEGVPVHQELHSLDLLTMHLNSLDELGLVVTARVCESLLPFKTELEALPPDAKVTKDFVNRFHKAIYITRPTLQAELKGLHAFTIQPKMLDVTKLLRCPNELFPPGVFAALEAISRFDFDEAGKCIAFERPTAAAFHILRATEQSVRTFYKAVVKQKRIKSDMWGLLTADIRKRPKGMKYENLLNHLDHIRLNFRNPTQHPEKIYDIHEVQHLWNLCADAVTQMQKI